MLQLTRDQPLTSGLRDRADTSARRISLQKGLDFHC
jgi:hypothetical protein